MENLKKFFVSAMQHLGYPGALSRRLQNPRLPSFLQSGLTTGYTRPCIHKKIVGLNLYTPSISFIFSCVISLPYLVDLLSRVSVIAPKHLLNHKTFPDYSCLHRFPLIRTNRNVLKTVPGLPPLNFLGYNFH